MYSLEKCLLRSFFHFFDGHELLVKFEDKSFVGCFICKYFLPFYGLSVLLFLPSWDVVKVWALLHSFFFKKLANTYFWQCWVFVALCRLSVVVASGGYSSLP